MKKGMGRIRLHVILDCSAYSLETFIIHNIEPGSIIVTDSWRSYNFIDISMSMKKQTKAVPKIMKTYMVFTWLPP